MKLLWDEGVDARYQKVYQASHPEHEYSTAQQAKLNGEAESMTGLNEQQRDLKVAQEASKQNFDAVITTDKSFLKHVPAENIPINVICLDAGRDQDDKARPPTVENLRPVTVQLEQQLSAIELGQDKKPEIKTLSPATSEPSQVIENQKLQQSHSIDKPQAAPEKQPEPPALKRFPGQTDEHYARELKAQEQKLQQPQSEREQELKLNKEEITRGGR